VGDVNERKIALLSALLAIILAISFVMIASYTLFQTEDNASEFEKIFKIGFTENIKSANAFIRLEETSCVFHSLIYDYLTTLDENLTPQPNLASSWWYMDGFTAASQEIPTDFSKFDDNNSPNDWPLGSIWEYNITENVFWSDGEAFTAYDVEWTINLQIGANFTLFFSNHPYTHNIDHVEAVNHQKVRIFFKNTISNQPSAIAFGENLFIPIMPKHILHNKSITYIAFEWTGVPTIGTGPFMGTEKLRDELIAGEIITLVRNSYYDFIDENGDQKGLGAAYGREIEIDKIQMKFFSEEATLQIAIRHGDIDIARIHATTYSQMIDVEDFPETLNFMSMPAQNGNSKQLLIRDSWSGVDQNPLRLDPAVQRAITLAINKSEVIEECHDGLAVEGIGLIAPIFEKWWWEPNDEVTSFKVTDGESAILFNQTGLIREILVHDLSTANQILDAAGYNWSGEEGNSIRYAGNLSAQRLNKTLGAPTSTILGVNLEFELQVRDWILEERLIAEILKDQLAKVGISIDINLISDTIYHERDLYWYQPDMELFELSGNSDPQYLCYMTSSYSETGWDEFSIGDETYDALYDAQMSALDYSERRYWVNKCMEWQYLSDQMNILLYPIDCYAYNNESWTNWGNWSESPGKALYAYWGENPLLWNLHFPNPCADCIDIKLPIFTILIAIPAAVMIALIFYLIMKKY